MLDLPLALGNVLLEQKEYTEAEHYFLEMLAQSDSAQSTWTSSNVYKMKAYRGLVYLYMATGEKEKEEDARNQFYALRKKK